MSPPDTLRQQLDDFVAAASNTALAAHCFGTSAGGRAAYANNTLFNRADALAEAFPTVRQLVGDDFFGGMARAFARETPSASGDLNRYGENFPDFMARFEPARELAYLPDCARLDWLTHRAYYAEDRPPFDFARLTALAGDPARLYFQAHPAAALIESSWPVVRIWLAHHQADVAFPALEAGGDAGLVVRGADNRVIVRPLAAGPLVFTRALLVGETLDASLQQALQADPAFDPGPLLQSLMADRVLIRCDLRSLDEPT